MYPINVKTAEPTEPNIFEEPQSPRFKSFGSGRNSLSPALKLYLRPNTDDSLCYVIDNSRSYARKCDNAPIKPWKSAKYNIKPELWTQLCGKLDAT